jgi:FemAB-related protein (PEP-CTERM system-associated)
MIRNKDEPLRQARRQEIMAPTESPAVSPAEHAAHPDNSRVQVFPLNAQAESSWDQYVLDHSGGTFFHQLGWKRVMERTYGFEPCYFYARRDNRITGIAPAFLISNWIAGRCLISLPFAVYGGVCASDAESERALVGQLEQLATERRVEHLELRSRSGDILPGYHEISRYSTFTIPLIRDAEALYKGFPKDIRYMIRKGEKAGLRTERGFGQLDTFYQLMVVNLRRLGTPAFPRALFENLIREYPDQVDLTVVYANEKAVAGGMSFFFRDWMQPYYIGSLEEAKTMAANNFLWWELIKLGAEKGLATFDFGRSRNGSGNFDFKKKWNPLIEPLKYQIRLVREAAMPNYSPTNSKFEKVMNLWKKMPLGLTRIIGPRVVRWFP